MRRSTAPRRASSSTPLSYFPELLPGELVYSAIARYAFQSGAGQRQAQEALFGRARIYAPVGLPFDLDFLASRLPRDWQMSGMDLVREHTLLRYYAAFLPTSARGRAVQAMLGPDGHAPLLTRTDLPPLGGLVRLRFCEECLADMISEHGEAYWRRDHQLPIVALCGAHGTDLRESTVQLPARQYVIASRDSCPADAPSVLRDGALADRSMLKRLSARAVELLSTDVTPPDHVEKVVANGFAEKGYRRGRAMQQLDRTALDGVADGVLARMAGMFPDPASILPDRRGWWRNFTQRLGPDGTDHVLLAEIILEEAPQIDSKPFGDGPWPCLNPLADHLGELVVTQPPALSADAARGVTGTFTCPCGYAYSRLRRGKGLSFTGPKANPKRVRFGSTLGDLLQEAERCDWTIEETAKRVGVFPTVLLNSAMTEGYRLPTAWEPLPTSVRKKLTRTARRKLRASV